jgi:hypothetical protein
MSYFGLSGNNKLISNHKGKEWKYDNFLSDKGNNGNAVGMGLFFKVNKKQTK